LAIYIYIYIDIYGSFSFVVVCRYCPAHNFLGVDFSIEN
jgi:hypothetical protein